jgi:tRNA pseudouridine55 synthase
MRLDVKEGAVLLIDKPLDWTSFDVVAKVRSVLHVRKVGHAGTLDPKATGLLIVCIGAKTREINRFAALEKEYHGVMELGAVTPSGDSETDPTDRRALDGITEERIGATCAEFVGAIDQVPPMYSAVKIRGRPLYRMARKGKSVEGHHARSKSFSSHL